MPGIELLTQHSYKEIDVELERELRLFWVWMNFLDRPTYTWELLADLRHVQDSYRVLAGSDPRLHDKIRFTAVGSRFPGIFCFGGDLKTFAEEIRGGRADRMARYAVDCIDASFRSAAQFRDTGLVTITLVQGDSLGGGFESALAGQIIVAERGAKFGLPEIGFNLFPGMGAVSFLARRIGLVEAERMILSGRMVPAEELHEMGVVQRLGDVGKGVQETRSYVRELNQDPDQLESILGADRIQDVTYDEMLTIVMIWAEHSLRLSPIDIRKMEKLVQAQYRRLQATDTGPRTVQEAVV